MTVTVANQWTGTFFQLPGYNYAYPVGSSIQVSTGNTAGNWLIALVGWQAPSTFTPTISVGDDAGNWWVPLGAPAGTSSPNGNVRTAIWAAPYAAAASHVFVAPTDWCPSFSVLILEVAGMGPGLSLEATGSSYANQTTTSVAGSLPAVAQQAIVLATAADDTAQFTLTMSGTGWTALSTVTSTNGSDHTADCVLVSGWQVTSAATAATWTLGSGTSDLACCMAAVAVTQAAPAGPVQGWPYIQFQAAFGAGIATPWDQLSWTDITPRYRGFSGTRGKQYELDSTQAASMQLVLSNNDGALTPGNTGSPYYQGISPWQGHNGASLFLSQAYAWSGGNSLLIVPDGVTNGPYAQSENAPAAATSTYSGFAAVLCPQGWTGQVGVTINWYTSGGTYISTTSGTFITAPAGQWVYPQVSGAAPATTGFASLQVQASGVPPSTTFFYADFCQLTGPAGNVLNQNWNFGTGPQVYTPVRKLATWAGRTYVAWRGFMERWPQSMSAARYTQSPAVATDIIAGLTSLLPSAARGEILDDNPWAYWPCGDTAGSAQAANIAPTGTGPLVVAESKFGSGSAGTQTFGANSNVFPGDPSATTWQQSGLATGATDVKHGFCLQYQASGGTPSITNGLTVECWSSFGLTGAQPNGELIIWALQGASYTIAQLWGSYDGTGGGIGWYLSVTDKATRAVTNYRIFPFGIESAPGWFHFAVTLTPSAWTVTIDGGVFTPAVASGTCNLPSSWQWITAGGSADRISTGMSSNISLYGLAVYPRVLPQNRVTAHVAAAQSGASGEQPDQRICRLLSYANMLVARRITYAANATLQGAEDIQGQAAAQNIANIAQSDSGLLSADRAGYFSYATRASRWNLPVTQAVGELAGAILNANWDFETSASPWTSGGGGVTVAQSNASSFTGSYSMLVTPNAGSSAAFSELVPAGQPSHRAGAYLGPANMGVADFNTALTQWTGNGLPSIKVTRYYQNLSVFSYTADMQEMVAAGVKIVLDLRPAYNPVSAADLANLTALLQTLETAGAVADITLWAEPFYNGLTAAQFQAMIQYYGTAVRQYYPLVFCTSVASVHDNGENTYYPGDAQVDKCATDFYANVASYGLGLAAAPANNARPPKPFGLYEIGSSTDPVTGQTQAAVTSYMAYIQQYFQARTAAGRANSDVLWFCNGGNNTLLGGPAGANAGFETSLGNWTASGATAAQTAAQANTGTHSAQLTASSAGNPQLILGSGVTNAIPVTPNVTYTLAASFRAATAGRSVLAGVNWYTSGGSYISSSGFGGATADNTTGWVQASQTCTAPSNAAYANLICEVVSAASSEVHYIDDVIFGPQNSIVTVIGFGFGSSPQNDYRIPLYTTLYAALTQGLTGAAQMLSPGGWASGGRVQINWYNAASGYLSTATGTAVALNAGQWTPVTLTATPPANAAYAQLVTSLAGSPTSSNIYYADQAQLVQPGEIPYLGDVSFDYDPSLVFNDLTLDQFNGVTVTASSPASMQQFGDQTLQETVYLQDPNVVTDLANWILANYGTPQVRVSQFTVDAAANPYAWPFVLSADVGTVITLTRRLGGTNPVISGTFVIQSVTPQIAAGQYQVRYTATPFNDGVLATNDPVRGLPNGTNALSFLYRG